MSAISRARNINEVMRWSAPARAVIRREGDVCRYVEHAVGPLWFPRLPGKQWSYPPMRPCAEPRSRRHRKGYLGHVRSARRSM